MSMLRRRKNKDVGDKGNVDTGDGWIHVAKRNPGLKKERAKHSDGKAYFSYEQIHKTICSLVPRIKEFNPDVILAIGEGNAMMTATCSHLDVIFNHLVLINFPLLLLLVIF